jgi:hypothetical protein
MFELAPTSGSSLFQSSPIFRNFQFTSADEQNFVRQMFQLAHKKSVRVHVLKIDGRPCGFIALSVKDFSDVPSFIIEYLFTSAQYRGVSYPELGDVPLRISEYLLGQAILMATDIHSKIPLRNIALQLGYDYLEPFYTRHGFSRAPAPNWMYMVTLMV